MSIKNKLIRNYWYILVAYGILLVGVLFAWNCSLNCEELGCLACVVIGIFALYVAAVFSLGVIVVQLVRGRGSYGLLWLAPIIAVALYGWVFTIVN